ncbi:MAG: AMP-binding protein [Acidobacteriota bacterium]
MPGELYSVPDLLKRPPRDRLAIVDGTGGGARRASYGELLERSRRWAGLLRERGLRRGDRVAIFLPRSIEAVVALFAVLFAGGVGVLAYERLRTRQLRYILEHSGAAFLLTDGRQLLYVPGLQPVAAEILRVERGAVPSAEPSDERVIGADVALLLYTSGSTGQPKGVVLSHENLLSGTRTVAGYLDLGPDDVLVSLLPFSFDYGLNQLLTALLVGGTLVLQRSTFPSDVCDTLRRERVTGMAGVPALWTQLTQGRSPFLARSFPHLRYVTNTGGRMPEEVVRAVRRVHPHVQVYLMYGLTEAFRSTYLAPDQVDRRPSSIGKAIPGVEILVVGADGHPCASGQVGELVHRGANVALGYWRDPEASAEVFRPHPGPLPGGVRETVVYSGDLVRTDEDGYLYFVGRRDQRIKHRGFRVSPEEVEALLHGSELVASAVVFGVGGDGAGERIVAAVTPKDGTPFREDALRDFCKREMPEYLRPEVIWRVDRPPLTASGKPDRPALREEYAGNAR